MKKLLAIFVVFFACGKAFCCDGAFEDKGTAQSSSRAATKALQALQHRSGNAVTEYVAREMHSNSLALPLQNSVNVVLSFGESSDLVLEFLHDEAISATAESSDRMSFSTDIRTLINFLMHASPDRYDEIAYYHDRAKTFVVELP